MTKFLKMGAHILPLVLLGSLSSCAWMNGMQEQFAVCSYDQAWDAAVAAVKDRSADTMDKKAGLIVTQWLEIPMPGRTYGVFRREVPDSKDRSRLTLKVKQLDDVARISFVEDRESWAFRGGSRLFGWVRTEPSDVVMRDLQKRLDANLREYGCTVS